MGALYPVFLVAAAAVAVPIYLHLFHRHRTRRLSFPALRYLERTEREHARQIRLRQLLLLLMRVSALALLVGAGARLFFAGRGASHPPTAVAVVLDNSLSTGLVDGERRVLDGLKELALVALDGATDDDRFWVIRAGEPWLPAIPGGAAEARRAVDQTEVSAGAGDLTAALVRARRLLETSEFAHREIHLVSDLQSTGFTAADRPAGDVPVVVWAPSPVERLNRALTSVTVGGGLPPLEGQRSEITVRSLDPTTDADSAHVPVRLVLNERIRGAVTLPPGTEATIAMPPSGSGWVLGYVDADPDDLRADDRRYFAFRSRPAPRVAQSGDAGLFLSEALAVLRDAGRIRPTGSDQADLLISVGGADAERRGAGTAALLLPADDPTLLPALNRRLAEAGIPWALEGIATSGESIVASDALPEALRGIRVRSSFALRAVGESPTPSRTLGEVDGRPWAVEGHDAAGRRYLLLASPMTRSATSLPVSTSMLRFVDWAAGDWAGSGRPDGERAVGSHVSAPAGAETVRFPSGSLHPVDGTRTVRGTGEAGFYTFLAGDSVVSVVALNPPVSESHLAPSDRSRFDELIGSDVTPVDEAEKWGAEVFRARQGPELWRPLLLAALVLLVLESLAATSGAGTRRSERTVTESRPIESGAR